MTRLKHYIQNLQRWHKQIFVQLVDIILCVFTVFFAFYLRVGIWVFPVGDQWLAYVGALLICYPVFTSFGLYQSIFRYSGWGSLTALARACAVYGMFYAFLITVFGISGVPHTVGLIHPILVFLTLGASRAVARYWLGGGYQAHFGRAQRRRVLIYGAGSSGRQLAAGLALFPVSTYGADLRL